MVTQLAETLRKQTLEGDPAQPGDYYLVSPPSDLYITAAHRASRLIFNFLQVPAGPQNPHRVLAPRWLDAW